MYSEINPRAEKASLNSINLLNKNKIINNNKKQLTYYVSGRYCGIYKEDMY